MTMENVLEQVEKIYNKSLNDSVNLTAIETPKLGELIALIRAYESKLGLRKAASEVQASQPDSDKIFDEYVETKYGGLETNAWHDAPVDSVFKDGFAIGLALSKSPSPSIVRVNTFPDFIDPEPIGFIDAEGEAHLSREVKGGYLYWGDAPPVELKDRSVALVYQYSIRDDNSLWADCSLDEYNLMNDGSRKITYRAL